MTANPALPNSGYGATSTSPTSASNTTQLVVVSNTRTALTTRFAPPASCSSLVSTSIGTGATGSSLLVMAPPDIMHECYPPGWVPQKTYSPGICPSGYATGVVTISGDLSQAPCCPTSFSMSSIQGLPMCLGSTMNPASTVTLTVNTPATIVQVNSFATSTQVFPLPQTTIVTTAPPMIIATPIYVQWQPSDVAIMSFWAQNSATPWLSPSSTLAFSPTTTPIKDSQFSPGLSVSAIAGIGFVLGTTILMLVLFIIFMCLRRKERKAAIQEEILNGSWVVPEIGNASRITHARDVELSGDKDPVELPVSERPQELPEQVSARSWRRSATSVFSFAQSMRSQTHLDMPLVPPVPHLSHQLPPLETGEFSKALLSRHWRLSITSTKNYSASKANSKRSRRERPISPPDTINTIKE